MAQYRVFLLEKYRLLAINLSRESRDGKFLVLQVGAHACAEQTNLGFPATPRESFVRQWPATGGSGRELGVCACRGLGRSLKRVVGKMRVLTTWDAADGDLVLGNRVWRQSKAADTDAGNGMLDDCCLERARDRVDQRTTAAAEILTRCDAMRCDEAEEKNSLERSRMR